MKKINKSLSKKGVASLYVVIFATILFGVITLSFIRIILSESQQTGNDDLSQSAYDSAMAGVEDAKLAVNKFYKSNPTDLNALFGGDCNSEGAGTFKLKSFLYPTGGAGEVKIQETSSSGNGTEQAYTCVILNNEVGDYRSTLTSDNRTKVVPLGIGSTELYKVKKIKISWYSEVNGTKFGKTAGNSLKLPKKSDSYTPPALSVTLLRTAGKINLDDFNTSDSSDYGSMLFLPSQTNASRSENFFNSSDVAKAGLSSEANEPYLVKCAMGEEFACSATLEAGMGTPPKDMQNAMLIVSMPYGDVVTDFMVELLDDSDNPIQFVNVQISVDSTGRANQLVRRVETRLDPADLFFPYPEYEVELTGGEENSFLKNFWITANCWTDQGPCPNNGSV